MNFGIELDEIEKIVKEEADDDMEGVLTFMFKIDTTGKVVGLKELSGKSLNSSGLIRGTLSKGFDLLTPSMLIGGKVDKIKGKLFDYIKNLKFKPGRAGKRPTICYVNKKFAFRKNDDGHFKNLLKIYNDGYKEVLKGKDFNVRKKFEKIVKKDKNGDFMGVYPYLVTIYRDKRKSVDAIKLYQDAIRSHALLGDFDKVEHFADELIKFREALWTRKDFFSLLYGEEYDKYEYLPILPEENRPVPIESINTVTDYIKYPKLKKNDKIVKLDVVVAALIDKKGNVKDTEIMHSARNEKLDKAAKKAVKKMKFNPATYNGEPVEYWYKVPVEFDKDKFRIDD